MSAASKQRILVGDDESAMSEHIADILEPAGFEVFTAVDGVAALEAFRSVDPHIVILDIFMPKKDGLEVLIELRHQRSRVPVLIISGKQSLLSDSSMGLAKQLGANDVLGKPFAPQELLNHVLSLAHAKPDETPTFHETSFVTLQRCIDSLRSHFGSSWRK